MFLKNLFAKLKKEEEEYVLEEEADYLGEPEEYEGHKMFSLQPLQISKDDYQKQRYYLKGESPLVCYYDGRVYYMECLENPGSSEYLWCLSSSKPDGTDVRGLCRMGSEKWWTWMAVNQAGIYLAGPDRFASFDLQGKLIVQCRARGKIREVCLHENGMLYYVGRMTETEDGKEVEKDVLYEMDLLVTDQKAYVKEVYRNAREMDHLSVKGDYAACRLKYVRDLDGEHLEETAWAMIPITESAMMAGVGGCWLGRHMFPMNPTPEDIAHAQSALDVFIFSEKFKKSGPPVQDQDKVIMVDLLRGITWVERCETEAANDSVHYWEPEMIWGEDGSFQAERRAIMDNAPIWKIPQRDEDKIVKEYFDGVFHYYGTLSIQGGIGRISFISGDQYGNEYVWGTWDVPVSSGDPKKAAENFQVVGDRLFAALGGAVQQYEMSTGPSLAVGNNWMRILEKTIPQSSASSQSRTAGQTQGRPGAGAPQGQSWTAGQTQGRPGAGAPQGQSRMAGQTQGRPGAGAPQGQNRTAGQTQGWPGAGAPQGQNRMAGQMPPSGAVADLTVEREVTTTEFMYNMFTFGAKFHIGYGMPVTVRLNGRDYSCKTHNTVKGRIDGLKKLYSENVDEIFVGSIIRAQYYKTQNLVCLEIVGSAWSD